MPLTWSGPVSVRLHACVLITPAWGKDTLYYATL